MEQEQVREVMDASSFDALLNSLYENFQLTQTISDEQNTTLQRLITEQKEELDSISFVKIMHMEGKRYEQNGNKNAARYCAMRILSIMECFSKPGKKRPRFLDMQPYEFPDNMKQFVETYTDFLDQTYRNINRRLMMVTGVLFLIVFLALVVFLHINVIMAGFEAVILGMLNYLLQKKRMPEVFQKNQLNAIEKYVEEDVLEFDRPIRYS